jgi:hypothetical protein
MDLENTLTGGAGTGVCLFLNSNLTWSGTAASSVIAYYSTNGGGYAMFMRPNGNFENSYGSYGATSDIKLKENIVDANPKLDKLLQLKVRNFNFIGKDETLIGFIAQELEEIMPGLISVSEDFDKDKNSLGTTTKSVKTSILIPILVKALQEMNVKVEDLTAKVAALEPKIARYESDPATGEGKKELMAKARKLEAERADSRQRSPYYTYAGSILQISIVLLTAAILAVSMPLFWGSIAVGSFGALLMSQAFWLIL